jgi:uncharacterized SAM-binding protein YcdF (DUF218 family)
MVGSGTFSFLIWIFSTIVFGLLFYLSVNGRWMRIPSGIRCAGYLIIGLTAIVFTICLIAMASHFKDKGEENLDYIIVLGAQMKGGSPSTIYRFRLDAAYEYLMKNPDTICIVSGGKGKNETVSEGDGGKEYLISRGIDPERIIAETKARDTVENILFSKELMDQSTKDDTLRIGIVTNNFHVFRGIHLAKDYTENEVCGIAAYTVPWYLPNNMVRECFGIGRDLRKMR